MGRKLYVGNLPYSIGEGDLQDLFAKSGKVDSVKVMRDMATGRARGFGFVEMATDEDAQRAIQEFNEYDMGGRKLVRSLSIPARAAAVDSVEVVAAAAVAVAVAAAIANRAGSPRFQGRRGNPPLLHQPVEPNPPRDSGRTTSTASQLTRMAGSSTPCAIRSPADTRTGLPVKFNTAIFTSSSGPQ